MSMRRTVFVFCVATLLVGAVAFGQATKGSIHVTVADADGRVLPGATVSVQSAEALGTRATIADASGVAIVPGLEPSDEYLVTVSLSGFNTARYENVLVNAGSVTALPVTLSVAAVEAEIIVTATAISATRQSLTVPGRLTDVPAGPSRSYHWSARISYCPSIPCPRPEPGVPSHPWARRGHHLLH